MPTKKGSKATKKKVVKKVASKKPAAAKKKPVAKKKKAAPAKKVVAKKKVVTKKKPATKKKVAAKKKSVAKKVKTLKKSVAKKTIKEVRKDAIKAVEHAPMVTVTEKRIEHANKPVEVHRRVVFVGTCANCDHVPMRVGKMLALMSLIIFVLSGIIIVQAPGLELPSIQFAGADAPIEINFHGLK